MCTLANGTMDKVCTVVFDDVFDDDQQGFHCISCHIVPWMALTFTEVYPFDIVFKVCC